VGAKRPRKLRQVRPTTGLIVELRPTCHGRTPDAKIAGLLSEQGQRVEQPYEAQAVVDCLDGPPHLGLTGASRRPPGDVSHVGEVARSHDECGIVLTLGQFETARPRLSRIVGANREMAFADDESG
jgi:hypothetical protein